MSDGLGFGSVSERRGRYLRINIRELFSSRACNSLEYLVKREYVTLRDVVVRDRQSLLRLRGMGEKSVDHIEERLGRYGLRLNMTEADIKEFLGE